MPPNSLESIDKSDSYVKKDPIDLNNNSSSDKHKNVYKLEIVWRNVIGMSVLHVLGFYGFYLGCMGYGRWPSILWAWVVGVFSAFGILSGAHRLWCHRSYKAKLPLKIILAIMQTVALQNDIYEW